MLEEAQVPLEVSARNAGPTACAKLRAFCDDDERGGLQVHHNLMDHSPFRPFQQAAAEVVEAARGTSQMTR